MKSSPPSVTIVRWAALLLIVLLANATAQVGASTDVWIRAYGQPLSENAAEGVQTLTFRKDGMDIVLVSQDGIGRRATYRKKGINRPDAQRLLDLNRDNAVWSEWEPPGVAEPASPSTRWRRSDGLAMAALTGDELTVTFAANAAAPPQPPSGVTPTVAPLETAPAPVAPAPSANPSGPPVLPVSASPKPRPAPPAKMPALGASRQQVLAVLGAPRGNVRSGTTEIWTYDWGQVILEKDQYVTVEFPKPRP